MMMMDSIHSQYLLETMINLLHLDKVANSIVGNENIRGLSGGEKRRVSDDEDDSDDDDDDDKDDSDDDDDNGDDDDDDDDDADDDAVYGYYNHHHHSHHIYIYVSGQYRRGHHPLPVDHLLGRAYLRSRLTHRAICGRDTQVRRSDTQLHCHPYHPSAIITHL